MSANKKVSVGWQVMAIHFCPICRNEWDCDTADCDGKYREKWCKPCRIKVTRYLTGQNVYL